MRIFVVLAAVLLSTVAAPTDCDGVATAPSEPTAEPIAVPTVVPTAGPTAVPTAEPTAGPADPIVHYQKETNDEISRNTTADIVQSKTKSDEKIKFKQLKGGRTKEIIVDTSKTKTKKDSISDEYSQSCHALTKDGVVDSTSLTKDHQHELKEVDVVKKRDKEVIIRDADGNIISDKKKSKTKEKTKKKEKDQETSTFVHTVKNVDPAAADVPVHCDDAPTISPPAAC